MVESVPEFWSGSETTSRSDFRLILHDPECQNNCCSKRFQKSMHMQPSINNDLDHILKAETCNAMESITSPTISEDQFLFNTTTANVSQDTEYRKIIDQSLVDTIKMAYSEFRYAQQAERTELFQYCKGPSEAVHKNKDNSKGVLKRKRKRTIFTTEQIIAMESVFKKRPYISREERLCLTQRLNISEKAIKIWFQNRRRVTEKGEKDQSILYAFDSTVENATTDHTARLDCIEAQIIQTTDERGFVTLDSNAISELVNVIDLVLSQKNDCDDSIHRNKIVIPTENYLMYEPISPESLPDENRETEDLISKWSPSEPEESLRRLIDIHNVFLS